MQHLSKKPMSFDDLMKMDQTRVKKLDQRRVIKGCHDAFDILTENWDRLLLAQIQEYKALVLSDSNRALYEVSLKEHMPLDDKK